MVALVCLLVKSLDRRDIVLLAVGLCPYSFCLGHSLPPVLQSRRVRGLPEGMVEAHGDAPVTHGATGVCHGDRSKRFLRLLEPKGVLDGDSALELRLCFCIARDGKVHGPKLFRIPSRMLVFFVR